MRANSSAETISTYVAQSLQLALLLEVSSKKPGNIHSDAHFQDTRYEHFLASAVAAAPYFKLAAKRGVAVSLGRIRPEEIRVGELIRDAVRSTMKWQRGGNTILGSTILLLPIAAAAGMMYIKGKFSVERLRKNVNLVVKSTTPKDAVAVYKAIEIAKPGGMGKAPKLDVKDKSSKQKILRNRTSLYEVFKVASEYDSIASEWTNNYTLTFDLGYPFLHNRLKENDEINEATVHVFLKILSEKPDTLIQRKVGHKKAKEISNYAKRVLELGGLKTLQGKKTLLELDKSLRDPEHKLNPGTTADIVSAVLALVILEGYRP